MAPTQSCARCIGSYQCWNPPRRLFYWWRSHQCHFFIGSAVTLMPVASTSERGFSARDGSRVICFFSQALTLRHTDSISMNSYMDELRMKSV